MKGDKELCVAHPSIGNRCSGWQKAAREVREARREVRVAHSSDTRGMWKARWEGCVVQLSGNNRCSRGQKSARGVREVRGNETH